MPNLEEINEIKIELDFDEIIKTTCEDVSDQIRTNANSTLSEDATGKYANNWTYKTTKNSKGQLEGTVYNKDTYRLSHLLENGHVVKNKYGSYDRTAPKKHVKPAFDKYKNKFIKEMSSCRYKMTSK